LFENPVSEKQRLVWGWLETGIRGSKKQATKVLKIQKTRQTSRKMKAERCASQSKGMGKRFEQVCAQ